MFSNGSKVGGRSEKLHRGKALSISAINPPFSDDDENRENYILGEKTSNNNIPFNFKDDNEYVDDRQLYQEKLKRNRDLLNENISSAKEGSIFIRNQLISPTDAQYRYLDGEKDNRYMNRQRINTKKKLRTRSENGPNEICNGKSDNVKTGDIDDIVNEVIAANGKQYNESLNEEIANKPTPAAKHTVKISPAPAKKAVSINKGISECYINQNNRRQSPQTHRVLLYNNNISPRFSRYSGRRHYNSVLTTSIAKRSSSVSQVHDSDSSSCESIASNGNQRNKNKNTTSKQNVATDHVVGAKSAVLKNGAFINAKKMPDDDFDGSSIDDDLDLDRISNFGDSFDSISSSDSEDGYRSHAYKFSHQDKISTSSSSTIKPIQNIPSFESSDSLENPESLLVPSLFPHVPPYLSFSSNLSKGPPVPIELYKVLKWKVTNVMPKLVRIILANSGVRLLKNTNDWMGIWGKHMKSPNFKTIRPYQKINHLPGSFRIGRKDACWKNLQKQMQRHGKKDFGFMPKTYVIPQDLNLLRKSWPRYAQHNFKWIIKPPASARGAGIKVVNRWAQIPKRRPLIVQKYIDRPLLINGSKFDLRLYVLVTSVCPLRVFMYNNGLARFASVKYSDKSDTLSDRCMHLTNYSINKLSSNYSKNEDVHACHGHKWTIKSLWTYLENRGVRTDRLWEALRNLVLKTILAGENPIYNMFKMNVESKYSCFELFGFDVLLDADLIPWLLEVNISPSLHSDLPLDEHVKAPLVQGVLNTALYNVPPKLTIEKQKEICSKMNIPLSSFCFDRRLYVNYLSRAEKMKHSQFTRKNLEDRDNYINEILEDLTPDDVRCLIVAEDEFARCAPLERIFPTHNSHKLLMFSDYPRYYNRLLDAWEHRYAKNRQEGIALLKGYCEKKYHLQVPPLPAKKDSSDDGDDAIRADESTNPMGDTKTHEFHCKNSESPAA